MLGRVEDVVGELELQRAGEVLDRGDVGEDLGDALLDEVAERLTLDRDQVGQLEDGRKLGERDSFAGSETRQGHPSEEETRADQGQERSAVKRTGRHG